MPRFHICRWPAVLLVASLAGCTDHPSAPTKCDDLAPRASGVALVEIIEVAPYDERGSDGDKGVRFKLKQILGSGQFRDMIDVVTDSGGLSLPGVPKPDPMPPGPANVDSFAIGRRYWVAFPADQMLNDYQQGIIAFWPENNRQVATKLKLAIKTDAYRWQPQFDQRAGLTYGHLIEKQQWRVRVEDDETLLWEKVIPGKKSDRYLAWGLWQGGYSGYPAKLPPSGWVFVAESATALGADNEFNLAAGMYYVSTGFDPQTGQRVAAWVSVYQGGLSDLVHHEYDPANGRVVREDRYKSLAAGGKKVGGKTEDWRRKISRTFDPKTGDPMTEEVFRFEYGPDRNNPWIKVPPEAQGGAAGEVHQRRQGGDNSGTANSPTAHGAPVDPSDRKASVVDHAADAMMIKRAIESLSDPNEHVRRNAAENLGKFGPAAKEAIDELIRALSDKSDADLRMYAARALGAIGPDAHKAVPALRQALSDRADFGSRFVRTAAAKALGRIGSESAAIAVDELLPLLGDEDLYVRRAASEALGQLGQKAVPGLIRSLEHENPEVRFRATTALARMRDAARPALVQALTSENVFVRQGAARAFASYYVAPQIKAVPELIEHLRDEDPTVRKSIAAALAECAADSQEAVSALLGELQKDDEFAFEIVVALSRTANREKVFHGLLRVLDDQPPLVRAQVIRAVGLADHDSQTAAMAVPVLQEELNDPEVGRRTAEALFRIASGNDQVKRQLDAYFRQHKVDDPYPGYRDDVRLAVRNMDYEGPEYNFSAPEAISAARRIFSNLDFVGKSEREVVAILGDPKALSAYARAREDAPAGQLVYRYETGFGGLEYKVIFKDGRVDKVEGGALY